MRLAVVHGPPLRPTYGASLLVSAITLFAAVAASGATAVSPTPGRTNVADNGGDDVLHHVPGAIPIGAEMLPSTVCGGLVDETYGALRGWSPTAPQLQHMCVGLMAGSLKVVRRKATAEEPCRAFAHELAQVRAAGLPELPALKAQLCGLFEPRPPRRQQDRRTRRLHSLSAVAVLRAREEALAGAKEGRAGDAGGTLSGLAMRSQASANVTIAALSQGAAWLREGMLDTLNFICGGCVARDRSERVLLVD